MRKASRSRRIHQVVSIDKVACQCSPPLSRYAALNDVRDRYSLKPTRAFCVSKTSDRPIPRLQNTAVSRAGLRGGRPNVNDTEGFGSSAVVWRRPARLTILGGSRSPPRRAGFIDRRSGPKSRCCRRREAAAPSGGGRLTGKPFLQGNA